MKKNKYEEQFLEELARVPIIQVACEKTRLSRNTIYRWRKEDAEFSKKMDKALFDGESFVNDMSESQLLQLIKEKSFPAIRFWLNHRHHKFKEKVEVTAKIIDGTLTQEQESIIREALHLTSTDNTIVKPNKKQYE